MTLLRQPGVAGVTPGCLSVLRRTHEVLTRTSVNVNVEGWLLGVLEGLAGAGTGLPVDSAARESLDGSCH